jgi:hypothetical protein
MNGKEQLSMYGINCVIVHRQLFWNKVNIFFILKPGKQAFFVAPQTAHNRTIEELKFDVYRYRQAAGRTHNRTIEELKYSNVGSAFRLAIP